MSSLPNLAQGRRGSSGTGVGEIQRITIRQATNIHEAAKRGIFGDVDRMLSSNPNLVNEVDQFGQTPLHLASFEGFQDVVELLVTSGSSLSIQDKNGWTPLHCASSNRHLHIVERLIIAGADLNAFVRVHNITIC
jgi:ankyrin repeat protein